VKIGGGEKRRYGTGIKNCVGGRRFDFVRGKGGSCGMQRLEEGQGGRGRPATLERGEKITLKTGGGTAVTIAVSAARKGSLKTAE